MSAIAFARGKILTALVSALMAGTLTVLTGCLLHSRPLDYQYQYIAVESDLHLFLRALKPGLLYGMDGAIVDSATVWNLDPRKISIISFGYTAPCHGQGPDCRVEDQPLEPAVVTFELRK